MPKAISAFLHSGYISLLRTPNTCPQMRVCITCFVFLLLSSGAIAQKEADNWYFGYGAALNFSTCEPTAVSGCAMFQLEGCATISDKNGQLLFYTNGITVWNKNNQVMLNGTGLFGHYSSSQSGVIVPQPGNDSLYYVFTMDASTLHGLCYSIVNINRQGGLGEVTVKNTPLISGPRERLTAVRHANKKDVWVITRLSNPDRYMAWLLTSSGVSGTAVTSPSSNFISTADIGYLKASPDGKLLASVYTATQYWELMKFDDATGLVSNTKNISNALLPQVAGQGLHHLYGLEFSPDSRYVYTTSMRSKSPTCYDCLGFVSFILQYDISSFNSTAIANSVYAIDSSESAGPTFYNCYSGLQLAKNRKIYVTKVLSNHMSVISTPNLGGVQCSFQRQVVDLGTGEGMAGLPTFMQSYFDSSYKSYDFEVKPYCYLKDSLNLLTSFSYDSLRWDFGDPLSGIHNSSVTGLNEHTFSSAGTKEVNLYVFNNNTGCQKTTDTVKKLLNAELFTKPAISLGADTFLCSGDRFLIKAAVSNASSIFWQDGSSGNDYYVSGPGTYQLTATNFCGSVTDEKIVKPGICDIYVPNVFTPNADNNNDAFKALGDNISHFKMQVYNRYGQMIFESTNVKAGWDGTYHAAKQPMGAYTWVIEYSLLSDPAIKQKKGTIILLR